MKWRWLPLIDPEYDKVESSPRYFLLLHVPLVVSLSAFFYLPPVRRALGIDPLPLAIASALHLVDYGLTIFTPIQRRNPVLLATWVTLVNIVTSAIPAALTGRPSTVLWGLYFVYPHVAARAVGATVYLTAVFALVPLGVGAAWEMGGGAALAQTAPSLTLIGVSASIFYLMLTRSYAALNAARRRLDEQSRALAAEEERQRVAGDVHSSLGAALTEICLWLQIAASAPGNESGAALERARRRTRAARDELRVAVEDLEAGALRPEALEARLRDRLQGLAEAAGVRLQLTVVAAGPEIPFARVYRVTKLVEEAALNAVRHAAPRLLEVRVDLAAAVRIAVRDDGAGFDAGAAAPGRGLRELAEHAEALGGSLNLVSAPGAGTTVEVTPRAA